MDHCALVQFRTVDYVVSHTSAVIMLVPADKPE